LFWSLPLQHRHPTHCHKQFGDNPLIFTVYNPVLISGASSHLRRYFSFSCQMHNLRFTFLSEGPYTLHHAQTAELYQQLMLVHMPRRRQLCVLSLCQKNPHHGGPFLFLPKDFATEAYLNEPQISLRAQSRQCVYLHQRLVDIPSITSTLEVAHRPLVAGRLPCTKDLFINAATTA
jgi:hypothetical protein